MVRLLTACVAFAVFGNVALAQFSASAIAGRLGGKANPPADKKIAAANAESNHHAKYVNVTIAGAKEDQNNGEVFLYKVTPIPVKLDEFLDRFGKPDFVGFKSDEKSKLSRWLVYQKENVRIFFETPRYDKSLKVWTLKYFADNATTSKLTTRQAYCKIAHRDPEYREIVAKLKAKLEERFAKIKSEREEKIAIRQEAAAKLQADEDAKLKAIEDAIPKVANRPNYNRLKIGMSLERAQDILGPAKESSRTDNLLSVHWRGSGVYISAIFRGDSLRSKSIVGD